MAVTLEGVVQNNAESQTGWANGGLEGELAYQGNSSYGGKVGSGTTRYFHTGTSRNFTIGGVNEGDHIIVILGSLTPGKLDTKANGGLGIFCGESGTVFGEWYVDGSDTKSPTTLFLPYIIDPATDFDNVAGGFTTTGNPAQLNLADTFGGRFDATSGIMGNFNNGLVDQITIGTGLRGTGTGGTLQEWIDADEGTVGNRYGFLTTREGVVYMQGKMYFGSSGSSYVFNDDDKVIIFPDVPVATDFFEIIVENASSDVTMNGFLIQAPGTPKVGLTYISGTWLINSSTVDGARDITGGSGFTIQDSKITNSGQIDINGMSITGSSINNSTATSAVLIDNSTDLSNISDIDFIDNTNGHSIEITSAMSTTLNSIRFTGGGADGTTTADVYNNSGGLVTLNINGGDTPTVRNSVGSTTVINNSVTVRVTSIDPDTNLAIPNSTIRLVAAAGGNLTVGTVILNGIADANGVLEDTGFNFNGDQPVVGYARKASSSPYYRQGPVSGNITSNGFEGTAFCIFDEN